MILNQTDRLFLVPKCHGVIPESVLKAVCLTYMLMSISAFTFPLVAFFLESLQIRTSAFVNCQLYLSRQMCARWACCIKFVLHVPRTWRFQSTLYNIFWIQTAQKGTRILNKFCSCLYPTARGVPWN